MSKLKSNHLGSKVQPEVIGLVHDEVVSLCHKMYSSVSGIEIDGIICISLLDTKEQQVVKIHKTLKSVVADVARKSSASKNNAYPKITSILSAGSSGNVLDHIREEGPDGDLPNFQQDIKALNDLLKASNVIISANDEASLEDTETLEGKKSKRKRKKPQHRSDFMYDAENEDSQSQGTTEVNTDTGVENRIKTNEESVAENVDMTCDTITVKEEPQDPGYEDSEDLREFDLAGPKVMESSSVSCSSKDNERETPENDASEFGNREQRDSSASTERLSAPPDLGASDNDLVEKKVKSENTDQDSEYGITVGQSSTSDNESSRKETDQNLDSYENQNASKNKENQNEEVPSEWLYPDKCDYESLSETVRKSQEAEKHWLYSLAKKGSAAEAPDETLTDEVTRTVLMDKYYEAHKAHKGQPKEILVGRQEKDPMGRSWIQMVNANVNRYQQALMRSERKKQSDVLAGGSASGLLKSLAKPRSSLINADHLKALLKEPPLQTDASRPTGEVEQPARNVRDKSLTLNTASSSSDRSSSASVSPAPVVKIEVDEEQQSFPASEENPSESTQEPDKPPSGKLESRYPALFNQLQQAKKAGQPPVDQSDSLVNRLPFISFQELFAPANPASALPRMSDSITKQLLEQAKVNPHQKVSPPKKKSVWKWKKRYVRPKPNEGHSQSLSPVAAGSSDESNQRKLLGINMSAKKTFARKRVKEEESSDKEWTPSESAVDEDVRDYGSEESLEAGPRKKIKTRLSTGEKPRINFAEMDISDIELEEEEPSEPLELVSAYCRNNCGIRCTSFTELKIHEEHCTWISSGAGEEGADAGAVAGAEEAAATGEDYKWIPIEVGESVAVIGAGAEGTGSTGDNYKCTLCGLDFNQEYRWHYHMVKVHGVAADKTVLFR